LESHRADLEIELMLRREELAAASRQRELLYQRELLIHASQYGTAQLAASLAPALSPLYLQNHETIGPSSNVDVIFGNGIEFTGNPQFRHMLDRFSIRYINSSARKQLDLASEIVHSIKRTGGRFLVKYGNTSHYYELELQEALKKTDQLFRRIVDEGKPSGAHMPYVVDLSQQTCDDVVEKAMMKPEASESEADPENQARPRKSRGGRGREAALISEQLDYKRLNNENKALKLRTMDLAKRNVEQAEEIKNLKDKVAKEKMKNVASNVNEELEQLRAALKLAQASERTLKRQNEYLMQCINNPMIAESETSEPPLKKSRSVQGDLVCSDSTAIDRVDHQSSTKNEDTLGAHDDII
jgi:hypothetical protein